MSSKKIMIVDDEKDFAESLAFLLDTEGFKSTVATSGHELLERVKADRPDLILLDVMMPAYNGLEVLTALRGVPKYKAVPVILMSASAEPKQSQRTWVDFIAKPTDIDILLTKVRKVLGFQESRAF
jgi:CheY-like chemotaxis protein